MELTEDRLAFSLAPREVRMEEVDLEELTGWKVGPVSQAGSATG